MHHAVLINITAVSSHLNDVQSYQPTSESDSAAKMYAVPAAALWAAIALHVQIFMVETTLLTDKMLNVQNDVWPQ